MELSFTELARTVEYFGRREYWKLSFGLVKFAISS